MVDEMKSNLEPIEEGDLDLKKKFSSEGGTPGVAAAENKTEAPHSIEGSVERKEVGAEKEAAYSKILSKVGSKTPVVTTNDDVKADAVSASSGTDAESRIINLVKLAETKGIPHAVRVARHMEDNYTLDEFHDRLLGEELHDALVQKGMIREL